MHAERWLIDRLGFEVFNPKIRTQRELRRGRVVEGQRLYVPGYIFIRFDLEEDEWRPINWTPGIRGIMYAYDDVPAKVKDEALAPLLDLCAADGFLYEVEADAALFKVGSHVKVTGGPFASFPGVVSAATLKRLEVLVTIFGRTTPVSLRLKDVALV